MEFTKKELEELNRMIQHYLTAPHECFYSLAEVRDALLLHGRIENELLYEDKSK